MAKCHVQVLSEHISSLNLILETEGANMANVIQFLVHKCATAVETAESIQSAKTYLTLHAGGK